MNLPAARTLAEIPARQLALQADATALIFGAERVSYQQLEQRSNQVANALIADGLAPQVNVALLDRNNEKFFYVLFGAAKASISLVTVNFRLTATEVAYILQDSAAEYVFVGVDFLPLVQACRDQLPNLKKVIVIAGDGNSDGDGDGEEILDAWYGAASDHVPNERLPTEHDRAVQMYTSGTTGHPKGVMLSHAAMVCAAQEGLSVWPVMQQANASVLATMPLFHIAAANLCLAGLYAGGCAVVLDDTRPEVVVRQLADLQIRVVPLPPALIHAIIHLPDIHTYDLSQLDTLLIAGSGIPVALLREAQAVLGCGFALSYGMTECCGGITYLSPVDCVPEAGPLLASAGKPFGNNSIRIVDREGQDLPAGETGEILCQSDRLMSGYWHRPEATEEAVEGSWYHSGDAGYLDSQGYLYVVDRIKDMVISGGENIYPVEIENELIKHPAVNEVAVIGVPDDKWGESLLAWVILAPGVTVTAASVMDRELEQFLRQSLAGYKIPRRYAYVDTLPRNATGKVLKRELRAMVHKS